MALLALAATVTGRAFEKSVGRPRWMTSSVPRLGPAMNPPAPPPRPPLTPRRGRIVSFGGRAENLQEGSGNS